MKATNTVVFHSVLEMVGHLKTIGTQCRFISMLSNTEPKVRKDCPYKGVRKIAKRWGWLNINYNMAVRRRIAQRLGVELQEAEYTNGEVWYRHEMTAEGKALPLCVNKKVAVGQVPPDNKFYVQYFPHKSKTKYVLPNGDEVREDELKPFFYKQSERDDFKPLVITVGLENVVELRSSGVIVQTPGTAKAESILSAP